MHVATDNHILLLRHGCPSETCMLDILHAYKTPMFIYLEFIPFLWRDNYLVDSVDSSDSTSIYFLVKEIIESRLPVKDSFIEKGIPTFIVSSDDQIKEKISFINAQLKPRNLHIILRLHNDDLVLRVLSFEKPAVVPVDIRGISLRRSLPFLLFLATVATVSISGYFTASAFVEGLDTIGRSHSSALELTVMYTIGLMGILGMHELGHMLMARHHGIEMSWPMFIPGIPGITLGTFGAIIRQKSPVESRDQLFDLGLSGPLVGFGVSLIPLLVGLMWTVPFSETEFNTMIDSGVRFVGMPFPILAEWIGPYVIPQPSAFGHLLHPLFIVGWIGLLVTFLNLFPIGQLDAGHISRALVGHKWFRIISYVSVIGMVAVGGWAMALIAIFMLGARHPAPLDDVSTTTRSRQIATVIPIVVFLLSFTNLGLI